MFILEYIKHPKSVGAIAASGKYLANKMIETIDFEKAKCIVEYGPGTGVFTEKILSRVNEDTTVLLVEINKEFYNTLKAMYGHKKNVIIINDSAEHINEFLKKYGLTKVDYIVSGLPFTSLPEEISHKILSETAQIIKNHGVFITFQYTLLKLNFFKKYFGRIKYNRVIRNLPPAYVLKCTGERNENISRR